MDGVPIGMAYSIKQYSIGIGVGVAIGAGLATTQMQKENPSSEEE